MLCFCASIKSGYSALCSQFFVYFLGVFFWFFGFFCFFLFFFWFFCLFDFFVFKMSIFSGLSIPVPSRVFCYHFSCSLRFLGTPEI